MKTIQKFGFSLFIFLLVNSCFLQMGYTQTAYTRSYEFSDQVSNKLIRDISIDLRKIDVVDVLKFLATKADLNIVTSQNVNAKVTLFLKNVTIGNALDIILISSGLAVREKDGVLYVMTEEEYLALYGESYRDQRHIKMVQIKYIDPNHVTEALGGVKSAIGKVIIDKPTGTVVLIDTEDKITIMEKIIEQLDIPTIQRILPTQTEVYELNYNKVTTVEAQIRQLLTDGVGKLQSDEKTNRLVITDFPHVMRNIETIIRAFDRKTREVFIETKLIQVRLSDHYVMGIDWQQVVNEGPERNKFRVNNNGNFGVSGLTEPDDNFFQSVVGDIGREDLQATIEMLHAFGDTKTLAAPQITVENGQEASINVGSKEAYVTSTISQADSTTTTSESVTFVDVGVLLKVTPQINQEGFISMKVSPEVSAVRETIVTGNANEIPIINTTNASTQVTVKDGHTVLIGGLMKEDITKNIDKLPVLGDLPFVGALFRNTDDEKIKTELVIFLTPHIVNGDEKSPFISTYRSKNFDSSNRFRDLKQEIEDRLAKLQKREAVS